MANLTAFHSARLTFLSSVEGLDTKNLTFTEWSSLDRDRQIASIFVKFYNELCCAWDKANAFDFIPGEDGISIALQYINKNVDIILSKPERFNGRYIYRVAYNAMYCICHDLQSVKDRWDNETSAIVCTGEDELNLFDTVADSKGSAADALDSDRFEKEFWAAIESLSKEAQKVTRYLISGDAKDLKKVSKRCNNYSADPLRDVEVSIEAVPAIVDQLRTVLARFNVAFA